MQNRIREGDLIVITDKNEDKYLQIGQVNEIQNYPHSDDVNYYRVQFADEICEYRYLEEICKVLMIER
jgi:hypothetical protein